MCAVQFFLIIHIQYADLNFLKLICRSVTMARDSVSQSKKKLIRLNNNRKLQLHNSGLNRDKDIFVCHNV